MPLKLTIILSIIQSLNSISLPKENEFFTQDLKLYFNLPLLLFEIARVVSNLKGFCLFQFDDFSIRDLKLFVLKQRYVLGVLLFQFHLSYFFVESQEL